MGRKGSLLVEFIRNALYHKKYKHNLSPGKDNTFTISFPRKSKNIESEDMNILKDWSVKKGRKFNDLEDYTRAKGTLKAALRRSIYLEQVLDKEYLTYKFLPAEEVEAKRNTRKQQEKLNKKTGASKTEVSSSDESEGYGSSVESPKSCSNLQLDTARVTKDIEFSDGDSGVESPLPSYHTLSTNEILSAIHHDHCFGSVSSMDNETSINVLDTNDGNLADIFREDFGIDFPLTVEEYKDLLDDVISDDSLFNNNSSEEELQFFKVMKYYSHFMLGETLVLICSIMDELMPNRNCMGYDVIMDSNLYEIISSSHVVDTKVENEFMLYFLKPGLPVTRSIMDY